MKVWARPNRCGQRPVLCESCRQPVVLLPWVGWVLAVRGANSYDMCEGDVYCNHAPVTLAESGARTGRADG